MKNKCLSIIAFSLFFLLIGLSFASAVTDFVDVTGNGVNVEPGKSVTISFKLEEQGTGDLTNISFDTPVTLSSGSKEFDSENSVTNDILSLDENETSDIMSLKFNVPSSQDEGTYTGTLTVNGKYADVTESIDLPISLTVKNKADQTFCLDPNPDDHLRIRDITINNKGMEVGGISKEFGDDNEWYLLDDIEVEIEVENKGNDDINNIEIEWGLYDNDADEFIIDFTDEKDFDLRDDDKDTITISFNLEKDLDIDLEDLDDGRYEFVVRATGDDRETDELICDESSESIDVILPKDFVVLSDVRVPDTVSCGETYTIIGEVYNIGTSDQDDVELRVRSSNLGLDEVIDFNSVNTVDTEKFQFDLAIPDDADEKTYNAIFEVYDEDGDIFESDDNDDALFSVPIVVRGGLCGAPTANIAGDVVGTAKEGENIVVKATIANIGQKEGIYTVNANGFDTWAEDVQIENGVVTLQPGQSGEVLFTFPAKKDVFGEQLFNIQVFSGGKLVTEEPFVFNIEEKKGIFSGFTGNIIGNGSSTGTVVGIALINIILVIIIIIIAIRLTRKK